MPVDVEDRMPVDVEEKWARRRPRWRGPLISLGVLVALALAAEAAVRLFTDTEPPLLVVDEAIGRRYRVSYAGEIHDPESRRDVAVRFNRDGFRFDDLSLGKPAGTRRVAVIGDSMIAALQVPREQTAVELARTELQGVAGDEERWELLNFGVSGSGTLQQHVLLREVVLGYHPDHVVVVFFVGNDFSDNSPRLSRRNRLYFDLDEAGRLSRLPYPTLR
jgi:hypothetical protein